MLNNLGNPTPGNIKRPYFDIQVMIFHCDALQSDTLTRKAALERAETLWNILDNARNLNGIIVQGWVTSLEAGFSNDGRGKLLHAHRLTWQGQSRNVIPTRRVIMKQIYIDGGGGPVTIRGVGTFDRGEWVDLTDEEVNKFEKVFGIPIEECQYPVRNKPKEVKKTTSKKGGSK